MRLRVHIERLVIDEGVLMPRDREAFQEALVAELGVMRGAGKDLSERSANPVQALAREAATRINGHLPGAAFPSTPRGGPGGRP